MKSIVAFVSRPHGFNILSSLVKSKDYSLLAVYTHKLNPKSQDPSRSIRSDFPLFEKICKGNGINLRTLDSSKKEIEDFPNCDFIVEVSWRYLIPEKITKLAKLGVFGIHRGKLPEYAGAEPIKQAISNNEKEVVLSAHYLELKIDQGDVICTMTHPINFDSRVSIETNIQRVRDEITPLFSKIMFKTLKILENKKIR